MRVTLRTSRAASLMCWIVNGSNNCILTVCCAGAFRPADEVCVLRSYLRQREMLTQTSSMHIQHMQKALQQMNLLLHNVVSDITGVTGMKIIKAILAGERDPKVLARNRDERCKNSSCLPLPNHWSATIALSISLPCVKPSTSMKSIKPRLLIVTRQLSNKLTSNPMSRTMGHHQPRNGFRPATACAMVSMSATCSSKKAVSIYSPFPAWPQTLCLRWPAKSALT